MSENPFISIIVPLYNKEFCIRNTIESILNQSYKNFELIIINDGSTDRSLHIVSNISDNRIRIINKTNEGVSATRNRGIKEAKGDYILFLDADDYLYPDGIQTLIGLKDKYPDAQIYTGNFETQKTNSLHKMCKLEQEGYINEPFKLKWYRTWNMRLGSFIMDKKCFETVPEFHPIITIGEDVYFTDFIFEKCKIAYSPSVIMRYNRNNSSLSFKRYSIEKYLSAYLRLDMNNYYHKKINADCIAKDIIKKIFTKDYKGCIFLLEKNYKYSYFMITSLLGRVLHL